MIFRYGSYVHAQNDVTLAISEKAEFDARGQVDYIRKTWNLRGMLKANSQAELTAAINALKAAYAIQFQDAGLYLDDGTTATAHILTSSLHAGGVRVTQPPSFPEGDKGEYSFYRTYGITLEADLYNQTTNVKEFDESITFQGTGGPRRVFMEVLEGLPQEQIGTQRTTYRARQRGRALGIVTWPNAANPIWPAALMHDQTEIDLKTPRRIGPNLKDFETTWSYVFESVVPLSGRPHIL